MNKKVQDLLKKIFPIAYAFTKSVGNFVLGCIIHVALSLVAGVLFIVPVVGPLLSGAASLYVAGSLLVMAVAFSKIFEAPTELVGEDNQVSAILRKIFPISFKYCNKGKQLAVGIVLNVVFMLLVGGVMSGINLILTATVVGILLTSVVSTVSMIINIYFIAGIVVAILLAVDVIKAAKPVAPVKVEKEPKKAAKEKAAK